MVKTDIEYEVKVLREQIAAMKIDSDLLESELSREKKKVRRLENAKPKPAYDLRAQAASIYVTSRFESIGKAAVGNGKK